MLDAAGSARGEAAAVADAFDVVNDLALRIAGEEKVAVHRVDGAAGVHGQRCCDQRLPEHLAAIDALPAFTRARAAEQVVFERLERQRGEQFLERRRGSGQGCHE